jgi:hypothetical protein
VQINNRHVLISYGYYSELFYLKGYSELLTTLLFFGQKFLTTLLFFGQKFFSTRTAKLTSKQRTHG